MKKVNLKKLDKNEKRRLLLNKRHETSSTNNGAHFARPSNSNLFVKTDGTVAKTSLNKRVLAIVLAVVFILSVIPTAVFLGLRGRAEPEQTLKMDPVTMQVRINGEYKTDVSMPAGVIADNIDSVTATLDNPTNAEFVQAVIRDANGVETPIYAVGDKNHVIYYSVRNGGYTGVEKAATDTLILDYGNRYNVTFANATENDGVFTVTGGAGTFRTNARHDSDGYYIYGNEDLKFTAVNPAQDYVASSVAYSSATASGTERIRNSAATISKNDMTGDMNITVNFSEVQSYSVRDARDISNSKYYKNLSGVDNHGGTTSSLSSDTGSLNSVDPQNGTTTFYIFSQANSTRSQVWRLNMLSINGVDVPYPTELNASTSKNVNGINVTVTLIDDNRNFSGDSNKPRTFYQVDLSNVHQDVEVAYYFVNTKERTIIVKDLTGIEKTAAAYEDEVLVGRYYTFETNKYNTYTANYTAPGIITGTAWYPSDNLIMYTVKPGYNPYTVTTEMSYDNGATKTSQGIREQSATGDDAEPGTPLEVILAAGNGDTGRYNTALRHWGKSNDHTLNNYNQATYLRGLRSYDLLLTTLEKDTSNTWYAVALAQNQTNVQQLYLNAQPYRYRLEVDLNDNNASLSDSDYSLNATTGYYLEDSATGHTVADTNPYAYLPANEPTRQGKYFKGWQMVDANGNAVSETLYQASERINFDENTIRYALGTENRQNLDLTLRFKAIWGDLKDADATKVLVNSYYQTAVSDDDNQKYTHVVNNAEENQVKGKTALLYDQTGKYDDPYYIINPRSELYKTTKALNNDGTYGDDNKFAVYYDYRLQDLSVTKSVLGYPKTKMYPITVTLTRDQNSPVLFTDGQLLINVALEDSENTIAATNVDEATQTLTYELNLTKDQKVNFTNVPYGWSYEVTEPEVKNDYSNEIKNGSGRLTKDIDVDVTNMVDTAELFTNKYISGPDANGKYKLTLESWATGEKITKYDKEPIPTDIVLVVDQSGSMATTDMGGEFYPVQEGTSNKTNWKVAEAAGDTVYYAYDATDDKYYPVQAGEGTVYVEAEPDKPENIYTGTLPDGASMSIGSAGGSPVLFNIDTPYFYPLLDSDPNNKVANSKMQPVKQILVSGLTLTDLNTRRHAYLYIYTDDNLYSTTGKNGDGSQWDETIRWIRINIGSGESWKSEYMYITHTPSVVNLYQGFPPSDYWPQYIQKVNFIKSDGTKLDGGYNSADAAMNSFTTARFNTIFWGQYDFVTNSGDYVYGLYKQSEGHDHLYYVRDDGTKVNITSNSNCTVYREDLDTAYSGILYEKRGHSRTYALQESVRTFAELVAQNAADNDIDNRIAIVGFAGNEMPAASSGTEPIGANGIWDYTNTGMFVDGTFKNYNEITGYRALASGENKYINRHYYIKDGNDYIPVRCASNGRWYRLDTYVYISDANGNIYSQYSQFYEPVYAPLSNNDGNNYQNAFLNVATNDGADDNTYNDTIDAEIEQFSAYGGTYTSYGMAMANQIFANNPVSSGEERNRIVIVFTDGVPGGSGYEEDIAHEAIADAAVAKTQYGAEVYTIGLYPGYQEQVVTDFMNELSNNASGTTTENVYGTTKNAIVGDENAENEYFYTDMVEGKTYSVKAKDRDGNSTLGWWSTTSITENGETFNVYSSYSPMTSSGDQVDGHTQFYKEAACRNKVYVSDSDYSESATYYVSGGTPVKYEYRWYNSNGRVKDPKTFAGDNATNHVQFFTVASDDYDEGLGYYQVASDDVALKQKFKDISDNMSKTTVKLDGDNSLLRDVVTGSFANVDKNNDVRVYTVDGTYDGTDENNPYQWDNTTKALLEGATVDVTRSGEDNKESIVDVKGFNYSTNYLSASHPTGKKLVVEISNLDPQEVGFNLESNTDQSAVYQVETVGLQTEETLLAPFTIPYIHRPEYKLHIDGDDHTAKYTVKLKLTKDGENGEVALTGDQVVKCLTDSALATYTIGSNGEITVWENKALGEDDTFDDSLVLENVFKNLPDGYHVYANVSKTDDDDDTFTYSVKKNHQDAEVFDSYFELTHSGDEIDITSSRLPQDVVIKELTLASDESNDYTDKGKVFEIEVQLYDENGDKVTDDLTCGGTTYSEGKLTLNLRHDQARTIQVPLGYTIQVGEKDSFEYTDSYKKTIDSTETDIQKNADVLVEPNTATMVTVINTLDTTPQTGLFDNLKINPFIIAAITLTLFGAGWLAILEKRKRQMSEE